MQQRFAGFAAWMYFEDLAAQLTEAFKPRAEVFGQLFVNFAAQVLSHGRTLSCSGDGDLKVAAADNGTKIEIRVWNVVDAIAKDASFDRSPINQSVNLRRIGGC